MKFRLRRGARADRYEINFGWIIEMYSISIQKINSNDTLEQSL